MENERIEVTILRNLIFNEDFTRKTLPFINEIYLFARVKSDSIRLSVYFRFCICIINMERQVILKNLASPTLQECREVDTGTMESCPTPTIVYTKIYFLC